MTSASTCAVDANRDDRLVALCDSYSIDSRLLYNDIEQLSNKRFRYARRLVTWSRVLGGLAAMAAGAAGIGLYYQRAAIYRVWRLRNPLRVRRLSHFISASCVFSLGSLLFLISPIGFMRLHEKELQRTLELDAIAVAALVQEQNFRTLAAWAGSAMGGHSKTATAAAAAATSASVTTTATTTSASSAPPTSLAPHLVWRDVVVDRALLPLRSRAPVVVHADSESAVEVGEGRADAGVEQAKARLSSELLVAEDASTTADSSVDVSTSIATHAQRQQQQQRQVWTQTTDAATLQCAVEACIAAWEELSEEKARLVRMVF